MHKFERLSKSLYLSQMAQLIQAHGDDNIGTQIVCSLLEARADINIKNNEGNSPLDLAEDPTIRAFMKLWVVYLVTHLSV